MASVEIEVPFPSVALLPKKETQAQCFIARNTTFDGRGVKIAILDSGIDPGAPGLSVTSLGERKIIHMVDASGAGDVDTSAVVSKDANDDFIVGLTGRKLKIPPTWPKASNQEYHIGVKNGYEMYPKILRSRMRNDYIERNIKQNWSTLQAVTHSNTQQFKESYNINDSQKNTSSSPPIKDDKAPTVRSNSEKLDAENNQAKLDILEALEPNGRFADVGPTYDVICFQDDGDQGYWLVCVDTSEQGDLVNCQLLAPYSLSNQYGTISKLDRFNYVVNVHENGNLVELVGMSTAHGTHVASIAAACFPDEPERNGVAPGAQIISISIGDVRLGSMETGTSLIRGLSKAVEFGADIINMSYGEHSDWAGGRVMEVMQEVVNKFGIIYMASAGNRGPALTTIGTPPTTATSTVIGIGAWVSPEMMEAEYSMRERLPATYYTWTSRGPTLDGALGVSICAPGGAITSVPTWCLRQAQLMNGTSMSSPNAAGCVALLLSGMKQKQLPYSPFSVKRALENSALKPNTNYDVFAMGAGLIQVEKAFDLLSSDGIVKAIERDIRFHVNVSQQSPSGNNCVSPKNGIYLRQAQQAQSPSVHIVSVTPIFLDELRRDPQHKLDFDLKLTLVCDANYVTVPTYLCLSYMTRSFSVRVDPTGLPPGANYTSIRAYDTSNSDKRHFLFEVPITIIVPLRVSLSDSTNCKIDFPEAVLKGDQTQVQRYFIDVPNGATSAIFEIYNCESSESINAVIHAVQLVPGVSHRSNEFHEYFALARASSASRCIPVVSMHTLEVVYGKMWSSLGKTQVKASIQFFSLSPVNARQLYFQHSKPITHVDISAAFRRDELSPSIVLKQLGIPLKPSEAKIRVLGKRDKIFNEAPTYELVLTYPMSISSKSQEVRVVCPLLSELLYESEYESQLWMIFDANKRLLITGDAHPHKYSVDLEKGEYTLRFQIRHPQHAMLKKLEEMSVVMLTKVGGANGLSLDVYQSYPDAIRLDGKKLKSRTIESASTQPMHVANLSEKQTKGINMPVGSYFIGNVTLSKHPLRSKSDTFPVVYFVDGNVSKLNNSSKNQGESSTKVVTLAESALQSKSDEKENAIQHTDKKGQDQQQEMRKSFHEALVEFHLNWLSKVDGDVAKEILSTVDKVASNEDTVVQRLVAQLNSLSLNVDLSEKSNAILSLCDQILEKIKPMELLSAITIANKTASAAPAAVNDSNSSPAVKELDKKKSIVVEVLIKRGLTLCDMIERQKQSTSGEASIPSDLEKDVEGDSQGSSEQSHQELCDQLDSLYFDLSQWIDMKDVKVSKFIESHAMIRKHYARVVRSILKQKDPRLTLEQYSKLINLFRLMGTEWSYISDHLERSIHVRYPKSYSLF